ncbi:MAG: amidohydrolase, partial [Acidobacteriota bacterium]
EDQPGADQARHQQPGAEQRAGHQLLSQAVPDRPVALERVDGHAKLVNAAAMAAAGIDRTTPDPPGGRILHDAQGEPTGVLLDNAESLVDRVIPPASEAGKLAALEEALNHLASLGLTGVHDAGVGVTPEPGFPQGDAGWARVDLYRRLLKEGRLPIRVYVMLGGNGVVPPPGGFFQRPPLLGEGDGLLTVRALKLGVDGALGSRGAALEEPYADDDGNRGLVTMAQEPLNTLVQEAMEKGWQVAIHAIGDRGNRMALEAIVRAEKKVPGGQATRPRIEHAQVLALGDPERFADAGIIASIQPTHATSDRRWAAERLGPQRLEDAYAYRSLARAGVRLACGSDFPVESADPWAGLLAAMARQDASGEPEGGWRTEEALTPDQALSCFTSGAAWAAFMEDEVGRLMAGMRADFTILDGDPLDEPPRRLMDLTVLRTVVGGRTVYEAPAAGAAARGRD